MCRREILQAHLDLGIVGDVHQVIPKLTGGLEALD